MTGAKKIEYRSRPTKLRERVYIYACKTRGYPEDYEKHGFDADRLPHGMLIGTVEITNCVEWGDFEWHLANPKRLERPLAIKAIPQPGFFWPFGKTATAIRRE
jgi:hypothetical protein